MTRRATFTQAELGRAGATSRTGTISMSARDLRMEKETW